MPEQPSKVELYKRFADVISEIVDHSEVPLAIRKFIHKFYATCQDKDDDMPYVEGLPKKRRVVGWKKIKTARKPDGHVYKVGDWVEIYRMEECHHLWLEVKGVMVHEGQQYLELIETTHFFHEGLVRLIQRPVHSRWPDAPDVVEGEVME